MNAKERLKASEEIQRMLASFSAARYDGPTVVLFVTDSDPFPLQAVVDAAVAFRTDLVPGRNPAFPPSIGEFLREVRQRTGLLQFEAFKAMTEFVEVDTPLWCAICENRPLKGMPVVERPGQASGWYVPKDEVAAVSPQRIEHHRAILEKREERIIQPILPKMED